MSVANVRRRGTGSPGGYFTKNIASCDFFLGELRPPVLRVASVRRSTQAAQPQAGKGLPEISLLGGLRPPVLRSACRVHEKHRILRFFLGRAPPAGAALGILPSGTDEMLRRGGGREC